MPQKLIMKVNQEKFDSMKVEHRWKGDGTKNNPVIVDTLSILSESESIKFIKITSNIIFRNLVINDFIFSNCRNITIQGCNIFSLSLHSCQDNIVKDNNIFILQISYGGNNVISNNKMTQRALSRAKKYMDDKNIDYLVICTIIFLLFAVPIVHFVETFTKGVLIYLLVPFIFATVIFSLKIYIYSMKKRSRELPPNQIKDMIITDDRDLIKCFSEKN